jgi:hypothetical protein
MAIRQSSRCYRYRTNKAAKHGFETKVLFAEPETIEFA